MIKNKAIGLIVIGDEILSGRRKDQHLPAVIDLLSKRGLGLAWAQVLGDEPDLLVSTFEHTLASSSIVLSCGGIGGTPDDHTRQAAALALKKPLVRHPGAVELIQQRCAESGQPVNEHRLRMADFPQGAELIPNSYNKIAGFSVGDHHFVPGFPVMAWPMIEWVLDTQYQDLQHQHVEFSKALRLYNAAEGNITPFLEQIEAQYAPVKVYCLPHVGPNKMARYLEIGVKLRGGEADRLAIEVAFTGLQALLEQAGSEIELL